MIIDARTFNDMCIDELMQHVYKFSFEQMLTSADSDYVKNSDNVTVTGLVDIVNKLYDYDYDFYDDDF